MKRSNLRKLASILLTFLLLFQMIPLRASAATSVKISPDIQYQTFKGFGTSLSWWANAVGTWNSTAKKNEILDLLYDANSGLGLTVARYNIAYSTSLGCKKAICVLQMAFVFGFDYAAAGTVAATAKSFFIS